ncbi:hypothetical protein MMC07_008363 [Pseudocyphellaria aurata]|nr:hypothetical protein [Pseudocyphellaria aurata]
MTALGQTIAVVDRSGKVVSTSKHLINVFKEAKSAYRERKTEIAASRQFRLKEKRAHRLRARGAEDERLSNSTGRSSTPNHASQRSIIDRHCSSPPRSPISPVYPKSPIPLQQDYLVTPPQPRELTRRHTASDENFTPPGTPRRTMSSPSCIDMDLAYGAIPPPLPVASLDDEAELKGLVGKVKILLEEADCVQYSVTAIIASLQRNPDAMAAVALTLAEISNIASKMAPGVLAAMKGSAPAVFALLASPQFLIAAGVGVGVTIVVLGGFKIVKKIKARNLEQDSGVDEMLEIGRDIDRIDNWRRGIAEMEVQSIGTSVDGEFITPTAAALSRLNLLDKGVKIARRKNRSSKAIIDSESASSKENDNPKSSRSTKSSKEKKEKIKARTRKSSSLRLMFS